MGARGHEQWFIPRGSAFLPSGAGIAKLVEKLRKEKWLPDPAPAAAFAARTVDNEVGDDARARIAARREPMPATITAAWLDHPDREELRLVWPASGHDGSYPLTRKPEGGAAYALELHRASDYVYPVSRSLGGIPTKCACGDDLAFGWDEDEVIPAFERSTGIFAECEACSRTFDPSKGVGILTDPYSQEKTEVRGGAAHRFALKIVCGAFAPGPRIAFAPELAALVQDEFGREFFDFCAID
jgi:hypothetical protein